MVQPLDVSIKKPLKNYACEHFKQHFYVNLELYMDGKLRARERHVLTTKWVGKAYELVKKQKILLNIHLKNAVYLTILTGERMPLLTSIDSDSK